MTDAMNHFTDKDGFNGIRAQPDWRFRASQPPGEHPSGAYFTTYPPGTPNLARKLRIPRSKVEYVFQFQDLGDLRRLPGDRGDHIYYSAQDYVVAQARQRFKGLSEEFS